MTPLRTTIGVVGGLLALLFFTALLVSSSSSATGGFVCTVDRGSASPIPARLVPIYNAAANRYRLGEHGWSYLAAINEIETDFGRNLHTSSAGAQGWMQFMPGTWATYGVDADRDGKRDPYDPEDAIFAAANYLRASGAPRNWHDALYAYNHAEWYVRDVMDKARGFKARCVYRPRPAKQLDELPADPVERLTYVARWIEGQRIPYCWGGGHAARPGPSHITADCWRQSNLTAGRVFTDTGLDCSGAVRWLLVLSGYPDPGGLASDGLGAQYPAGIGRYVTIWANPAHIFITINGVDWGTSSANFAHGPGFGKQSASGFRASHPPGL